MRVEFKWSSGEQRRFRVTQFQICNFNWAEITIFSLGPLREATGGLWGLRMGLYYLKVVFPFKFFLYIYPSLHNLNICSIKNLNLFIVPCKLTTYFINIPVFSPHQFKIHININKNKNKIKWPLCPYLEMYGVV